MGQATLFQILDLNCSRYFKISYHLFLLNFNQEGRQFKTASIFLIFWYPLKKLIDHIKWIKAENKLVYGGAIFSSRVYGIMEKLINSNTQFFVLSLYKYLQLLVFLWKVRIHKSTVLDSNDKKVVHNAKVKNIRHLCSRLTFSYMRNVCTACITWFSAHQPVTQCTKQHCFLTFKFLYAFLMLQNCTDCLRLGLS